MSKKIFFILPLLLFFFSCSYMKDPETAFFEKNFTKNFERNLDEICKKVYGKTVLVPDIVNYFTLKPDKYGDFLTQHLKTALNEKCRAKIIPIELRNTILLKKTGSTIFSRDVEEIRHKYPQAKYIITGTYKKTEDKAIVFLKLINLYTGKVEINKTIISLYHFSNPMVDDPFEL